MKTLIKSNYQKAKESLVSRKSKNRPSLVLVFEIQKTHGPTFQILKSPSKPNQPNQTKPSVEQTNNQLSSEREKTTMAGGGGGGGSGGSLAGLQDHVKLARDYALEGLYDTSIIFFDGAIAQINRFFTLLFSFLL